MTNGPLTSGYLTSVNSAGLTADSAGNLEGDAAGRVDGEGGLLAPTDTVKHTIIYGQNYNQKWSNTQADLVKYTIGFGQMQSSTVKCNQIGPDVII